MPNNEAEKITYTEGDRNWVQNMTGVELEDVMTVVRRRNCDECADAHCRLTVTSDTQVLEVSDAIGHFGPDTTHDETFTNIQVACKKADCPEPERVQSTADYIARELPNLCHKAQTEASIAGTQAGHTSDTKVREAKQRLERTIRVQAEDVERAKDEVIERFREELGVKAPATITK